MPVYYTVEQQFHIQWTISFWTRLDEVWEEKLTRMMLAGLKFMEIISLKILYHFTEVSNSKFGWNTPQKFDPLFALTYYSLGQYTSYQVEICGAPNWSSWKRVLFVLAP